MVCGLGLAGALMARCDVAQAGHWKLQKFVVDGKTTYPSEGAFTLEEWAEGRVPAEPQAWKSYVSLSGDEGRVYSDTMSPNIVATRKPGSTMMMNNSGSAKAIFVWDRSTQGGMGGGMGGGADNDGSEPDEYVFAAVTTSAGGFAGSRYASVGDDEQSDGANPQGSVSVSASNGYDTAFDAPSVLYEGGQTRMKTVGVTTSRVIQCASDGAETVVVSLPAAYAQASGTGGPNRGTSAAQSSVSYYVRPEKRGVWISSSIETSYYKQDGATVPDLPEGRFRPNTPKSGPGPWAISHLRNRNGSMQVTSALSYSDFTIDGGVAGWHGGVWLNANEPGFQQPERVWSLSSGTSLSASTSVNDNPIAIEVFAGGSRNGTGATEPSSGITIDTSEGAGAAPGQARPYLENHYGIDWKLPAKFDKDLPWPADKPQILHQFDAWGPLSSPVEATSSFHIVSVSYAPFYIQVLSELGGSSTELGTTALHWIENDEAKLAIIAAECFASRIDFEDAEASINQNTSDLFNLSAGMDSAVLNQVSPSWNPLVPEGASWDACKLVEVMHHRAFKHHLKRFDEYDFNGYTGPKDYQSDTLEQASFVGRYERLNTGTPGSE